MKKSQINHLLCTTLVLFFVGCGNDAANDQKKAGVTQLAEVVSGSKIEIVQNDDAQTLKVEENAQVSNEHNDTYYYDYHVKSEYNPNSKPANDDASVRTKPRTEVEANMNIRSPYEKVQISLLVKKLSINFMVKCSACHDDYANGVIGPSLLGRDSDYIFNAINDFKTGKKSNVLMSDLIKMMSDEEIRALADEIYLFNQKIKELRK